MAWTLDETTEIARDGQRRIRFAAGMAYLSHFAKKAPRGDSTTPYTGIPTVEVCEHLWQQARMDTPVKAKRGRAYNPYAGRACFH